MMYYIIWSHTARSWVANPGRTSSFTRSPYHARRFATKADAERNCCGDEIARRLDGVSS